MAAMRLSLSGPTWVRIRAVVLDSLIILVIVVILLCLTCLLMSVLVHLRLQLLVTQSVFNFQFLRGSSHGIVTVSLSGRTCIRFTYVAYPFSCYG